MFYNLNTEVWDKSVTPGWNSLWGNVYVHKFVMCSTRFPSQGIKYRSSVKAARVSA